MIMKILWYLGLTALSGFLYWVGGQDWGNKLARRLGCALIALTLFIILFGFKLGHIWAYLGFLILNYFALSSYNDWIGYDCFWLTGLFYGLFAFPLVFIGVHWYLMLARAIFLALTIWWLRSRTGNVNKEEIGSGLLYTGSLLILFLPI